MKAQFETPEVKLLAFLPVDVITLSVVEGGDESAEPFPFSNAN